MKALLIGGTGTISGAVTALLLQNGWDVTLLNRGNRPLPKGAEPLVADIGDEAAVTAKLAGRHFDVVANFIAYTPTDVQRDHRLFADLTGQYIFISSATVYQKPPLALPITEGTPCRNPYSLYARNKLACEETLLELYRQESFPVTMVRPSHTYGDEKLPLGAYGSTSWQVARRILAGKPVLIHGDGTSFWTFTHNSDFAKGFVGLMANRRAIGQAVHITGDEAISWNEAYRTVAAALEKPLHAVHVPSKLLAEAGRPLGYDFEGGLLGDKSHNAIFDNSKLKALVPGFCATTRYDVGVRRVVANILANPALQGSDPQFDAFCDAVTEEMEGAAACLAAWFAPQEV